MKPERSYLDELNTSTKAYKVKVRVIEKGRAKTSPQKGTAYQSLLLQDDKGNRMRGALFGDQVEGYKDAFVYNGVYEIANAPIRRCDPQWKKNPNDLDFQMSFGSNTVIQPVDPDSKVSGPEYQTICQIPKSVNDGEKYDVLGIVLYVEPKPRQIVTAQNREVSVREMLIVDHSVEQPVIISAWDDLALEDCTKLIPYSHTKEVVAITALRVSSYKGFSLTTTMSTTFNFKAQGERADKLKQWAVDHANVLDDMQKRVLDVKNTADEKTVATIMDLHLKHARNTLQEERHWLQVTVPKPEFNKLNAYMGCSNCGKRNDVQAGQTYNCDNCSKTGSVSCPRVTFNCEVEDATGELSITAFTDDAEKMLGRTAPELFAIKESGNADEFYRGCQKLQRNPLLIQVGPKATLSRNNILQWVLKKVQPKPAENTETNKRVVDEVVPNKKQWQEDCGPGHSKMVTVGSSAELIPEGQGQMLPPRNAGKATASSESADV